MDTILFYHTNDDLREQMTRYLSWYGFEMKSTGLVQEAVRILEAKSCDFFIFELGPDVLENLKWVSKVRNPSEKLSAKPVVVAVYADEPDMEERKKYRKANLSLQSQYASPEKWFEKIQILSRDIAHEPIS